MAGPFSQVAPKERKRTDANLGHQAALPRRSIRMPTDTDALIVWLIARMPAPTPIAAKSGES